MRVVEVEFPNGTSKYHYFVPDGDDPKVGDIIINHTKLGRMKLNYSDDDYDSDDDDCTSSAVDKYDSTSIFPNKNTAKSFASELKGAYVVGVTDYVPGVCKATKPYVMLIPASTLIERDQLAQTLGNKVQEREKATRELEKMLAAQSKIDMFETLAAKNPRAAELLRKLKGED